MTRMQKHEVMGEERMKNMVEKEWLSLLALHGKRVNSIIWPNLNGIILIIEAIESVTTKYFRFWGASGNTRDKVTRRRDGYVWSMHTRKGRVGN